MSILKNIVLLVVTNDKFDDNLVERLHGMVRSRNKSHRGFKSEETMFVEGHRLYYDFICPHQGFNGYVPAYFANIYLNLDDKKWKDLLLQSIKYLNGEKNNGKKEYSFNYKNSQ